MQILPWTTLSLVIAGDDLASAIVSGGWRGVWERPGPVLRGFLAMAPEDARRALGDVAPGARILLTCPTSWVGLRPAAIEVRQWESAKGSIQESIESFFPLSAHDAMVGVVGRTGEKGSPVGAYLLAVSRQRVKPWLDAVQRVLGRPVDAVLTPHMALLGLGLGSHPNACVIEHGAGGSMSVHRLAHGEIEELSGPGEAGPTGVHSVRWLNGVEARPQDSGAPAIGAPEQAVAAAIAERVAGDHFSPLSGRAPVAAPRWVLPAAGVLVAIGLLWGAAQISDGRYARGIARLERESADHAGTLHEAQREHEEAIRLTGLLASVEARQDAGRNDLLADLVPALSVIPREGVLYGVQIDFASVTIRGEARRASDVLRRLEETPEFHAAKQLDTAVPVEERTTEQFHIRAERAGGAPTRAAGPAPKEPAK